MMDIWLIFGWYMVDIWLMLILWSLAVTSGVTHFGAYHRPRTVILTLTWWYHRTPADTPTRRCINVISNEHKLYDVACACYVLWEDRAAVLFHQGCPVPVCDCQVVVVVVAAVCDLKCSELQREDQSLLDLYRLCLLKVARVVVWVVWWADFTYCKEYIKVP